MTKIQTLRIGLDLWLWLAKNPGRAKNEWPGWIINGGCTPYMAHYCPCCEYVGLAGRKDNCRRCPLNGFAWEQAPDGGNCEEDGSAYLQWFEGDERESRQGAWDMVEAFGDAIWLYTAAQKVNR